MSIIAWIVWHKCGSSIAEGNIGSWFKPTILSRHPNPPLWRHDQQDHEHQTCCPCQQGQHHPKASVGVLEEHYVPIYDGPSETAQLFWCWERLAKKLLNHTNLLIKLVSIEPHPKLRELQTGIDLWAVHLGLVVADLPDCWSKHQAFALFQLLSKARKVAHNATSSGRQDAALKPLIQLLKETSKKRPPSKVAIAKTAMGPKARKLMRRTSSSPSSVSSAKEDSVSSLWHTNHWLRGTHEVRSRNWGRLEKLTELGVWNRTPRTVFGLFPQESESFEVTQRTLRTKHATALNSVVFYYAVVFYYFCSDLLLNFPKK